MEGSLEVREGGSGWNRRYIVAAKFLLEFYDTESSEVPLKTVDLKTVTLVGFGDYLKKAIQVSFSSTKEFYVECENRVFEFRAKSHADVKAWVEYLKVFQDHPESPRIPECYQHAFEACFDHLDAKEHLKAGIFSMKGNEQVDELVHDLLLDGAAALSDSTDSVLVGAALEDLISSLPQSVLTNSLVSKFAAAAVKKDILELRSLFGMLPTASASILKRLTEICITLIKHSDVTELSIEFVSLTIASDLEDNNAGKYDLQPFLTFCIHNHDEIFNHIAKRPSAVPREQPNKQVERSSMSSCIIS